MTLIEIFPYSNGAHANQTLDGVSEDRFDLPEGWAYLPVHVGTPETLENFPFGEITVETIDGVPVVTGWTPLPIPEPEPEPELPPSLEERVNVLETEAAAISEAIERGLAL